MKNELTAAFAFKEFEYFPEMNLNMNGQGNPRNQKAWYDEQTE